MNDHHTTNPALSIFLGVIFGIGAFFTDHPVALENTLQLFKVICFGTVGGFVGYFGKLGAERLHNRFKK